MVIFQLPVWTEFTGIEIQGQALCLLVWQIHEVSCTNLLLLSFRSSTEILSNFVDIVMSFDSNFTFYKMSNLDNRISNADQLLTQDVEKFCSTLTDLYSNLSKVHVIVCTCVCVCACTYTHMHVCTCMCVCVCVCVCVCMAMFCAASPSARSMLVFVLCVT